MSFRITFACIVLAVSTIRPALGTRRELLKYYVWDQVGDTIEGTVDPGYTGYTGSQAGYAVSISSDGTRVAIGSQQGDSGKAGRVQVYEYDATKTTSLSMWRQL